MSMKHTILLMLLCPLIGVLGACSEGGDGRDLPACPDARPTEDTTCSTDVPTCTYPIEVCPCGPSDLAWHCTCVQEAWSCVRDYDCYPCGDGGV